MPARKRDALAGCLDAVLAALRDACPEIGQTVAIDGSDVPAYANGQRYVSKGGKLRERRTPPLVDREGLLVLRLVRRRPLRVMLRLDDSAHVDEAPLASFPVARRHERRV